MFSLTQDRQGGKSDGSMASKGELVTQVPHEWPVQLLVLSGSKVWGRERRTWVLKKCVSAFASYPINSVTRVDISPGLWGSPLTATLWTVVSKAIG